MAPDNSAAFDESPTAPTQAGSTLSAPEAKSRPGLTPQIPDYLLVRRIGHGSYGEVWLGRSVMGTYRAVKIVYRDRFDNDRPYEREFEGIRKFEPISRTHDSQVDILHIGRNDAEGCFYYVMELADDANADAGVTRHLPVPETGQEQSLLSSPPPYEPKTLRLELHRRGRLPLNECVQLGISLATALEHLHQHGLIHRDIKPSNIIFVNGLPKLADIGLVTETEKTMSFVGTAGYLPPEGPGTVRGDIYSLGKVLYEAATGKDRQEFPELPTALGTLPEEDRLLELNEVLVRACHHDARKRYASASELRADLQLLREGESVKWKRAVQKRLAWAKNALIAVGIIAGLTTAAYFVQRHQTRAAQRNLYIANMQLAQRDWEKANVERLAQVLGETEGYGDKGFEWFFWQRQLHLDLMTLRGHSNLIAEVAFSPDGQRLVTGSADRTARVWDVGSGRTVLVLRDHRGTVSSVAFTPDGQRIITGSHDGKLRIWDASDGRQLMEVQHASMIFGVAISPDGQRIATVSRVSGRGKELTIALWDPATGEKLQVLGNHPRGHGSSAIAFSADGRRLAAIAATDTLPVWDVQSGRELFVCRSKSEFYSLAFSPDGKRLLTGSGEEATLWDATTGQQLLTLPGGDQRGVYAVAYSSDGKKLVTAGGDQRVIVWDAENGKELFRLSGHRVGIVAVAFSPDAQRIATGSADGTAKIWDAREARNPWTFPTTTKEVHTLALSPDGSRLATATWYKSPVRLWEASTGRELFSLPEPLDEVTFLAFSPDSSRIATGNGWYGREGQDRVKIWDCANGRELLALNGKGFVAFSPDGLRIATASGDRTATIWHASTGEELVTLMGHADWVECGAFSPDGERIATVSAARKDTRVPVIKIWDVATGRERLTIQTSKPGSASWLTFSPNGKRIALADNTRTPLVFDAFTGRELFTLHGHVGPVGHLTFSPDGKRLLTFSQDRTAKMWYASTGRELLTLEGHTKMVRSGAFFPDGRRIATGGLDGTVKIWESASPEQVSKWNQESK